MGFEGIDPQSALLFQQKLANPNQAQNDAADFTAKVLATPSAIDAVDRADRVGGVLRAAPPMGTAGPLGPLGLLGGSISSALGGRPGTGRGGPDDLSAATQRQLRVDAANDNGPYRLVPITGQDPNIQAAPTLAEQAKKAAQGGGGMGAGNGLKSAYDQSREAGLRTLAEERELTGQKGIDQVVAKMGNADLQQAEGERLQRQADIEQQHQEQAHQRFDDFLAKSQSRINDIAAAKVDPGRLLRGADAKTQFSIGLGSALGGALAAVNGGPNTSIEHLDRIIQRDIRAQENHIDNLKSASAQQNSLLGQLIADSGSREIGRKQLYAMTLEAAKTKLQADADRLGIPEMRTNAELASNAIQQKIDQANTQIKKDAWELYQKQAAAAAAAQRAAEEKAYQRQKEAAEFGLKQDELKLKAFEAGLGPDGKPLTGPDGKPLAGAGLTKEGRNELAKEQAKAQMETDANQRMISDARKNLSGITAGTSFGEKYASLPGFLPGVSSARMNKQTRDDFNNKVGLIVGGAYKLSADSPEPRQAELRKQLAGPYEIHADDGDDVAAKKMNSLEELLGRVAAAKGAALPMPASVKVK